MIKYFLKYAFSRPNYSRERIRRKEFLCFVLYYTILIVLWNLFNGYVLKFFFGPQYELPAAIYWTVSVLFSLWLLWAGFINISGRLNDTDDFIGCSFGCSTFLLLICLSILYFFEITDSVPNSVTQTNFWKFVVICFKLSLIILCCFLLKKGTKGNNQHGPDPRINDPIEMAIKATEYRKAAEMGDVEAQYNLGICYYKGCGVTKDFVEAVKWLARAAKQGNVAAQYNLAVCYAEGKGVPENQKTAVRFFQEAAEQGNAEAQYNLGICYIEGEGVYPNIEKAEFWFRKAEQQGNLHAKLALQASSKKGEIDLENESIDVIRQLAGTGNAKAQFKLGFCYESGKGVSRNLKKAIKWFLKAAKQGNAEAQYKLGICYENGKGVSKNMKEAVKWYNKAAEQGNAEAQYKLGICYENGKGVSKNMEEAVKWYRKIAEHGNAEAQYKLGICYYYGTGVSKDVDEAVSWFRQAAEQGNAEAQYNLGVCYEKGYGVSQNIEEAKSWFRKANMQGNREIGWTLQPSSNKNTVDHKNEPIEVIRQLAENGNDKAQIRLGICYEKGEGVPQNMEEALKWYRKASVQGNVHAKKYLDTYQKMNIHGIPYNISMEIASYKLEEKHDSFVITLKYFLRCLINYINFFGRARRKEFWYFVLYSSILMILWHLAWMGIDSCFNIFQKDPNSENINYNIIYGYYSLYLFLLFPFIAVTERRLHDNHISLLGFIVFFFIYVFLSLCMFRSEIIVAIIFYFFIFVIIYYLIKKGETGRNDFGSNPRYFDPIQLAHVEPGLRQAAEQGNTQAQCNLGNCYYYGIGVSKDLKEAVRWFRQSAEQGDSKALNNLGVCFKYGEGVPKDMTEAIKCFHQAAKKGNAEALYNLALCYTFGDGVSKNLKEAATLFRKAKQKGNCEAERVLHSCTKNNSLIIEYLPLVIINNNQPVEDPIDVNSLDDLLDSSDSDGGDDDGDWDCDFDD